MLALLFLIVAMYMSRICLTYIFCRFTLVEPSLHDLLKPSRAIIVVKSEGRHVKLQIFPIRATMNPKKNPKPRMNTLSRINMRIPTSEKCPQNDSPYDDPQQQYAEWKLMPLKHGSSQDRKGSFTMLALVSGYLYLAPLICSLALNIL